MPRVKAEIQAQLGSNELSMHLLEQAQFEPARPRFVPVNLPWQRHPQPSRPLWSFLELCRLEAAEQPHIPPQSPRAAPVQLLPLRTPSSPTPGLHPEPSWGSFPLLLQEGQESSSLLAGSCRSCCKKLDVYSSLRSFLLLVHSGASGTAI